MAFLKVEAHFRKGCILELHIVAVVIYYTHVHVPACLSLLSRCIIYTLLYLVYQYIQEYAIFMWTERTARELFVWIETIMARELFVWIEIIMKCELSMRIEMIMARHLPVRIEIIIDD